MSNGWKLVPVDPTEEMLEAGRNTPLAGDEDADAPEDYRAVFVSMVEAAPQPPSVGNPIGYVLTWDGEVYYESDDGVVVSNTPGDELSERHKWVAVYTQPPPGGEKVEVLQSKGSHVKEGIEVFTVHVGEGSIAELVDRAHVTARDQQIAELQAEWDKQHWQVIGLEQDLTAAQARIQQLEAALTHVRDKIRQSDVSWGTGLLIDNALAQQVNKP